MLFRSDIASGVMTRRQLSNFCFYTAFISKLEPKKYQESPRDNNWVEAMQDEFPQFKKQQVWELCPLPPNNYQLEQGGCSETNQMKLEQ